MKCIMKLMLTAVLLLGLTACGQQKVPKTATETENNVIPATSNAPEKTKNETAVQTPKTDKTETLGTICNNPGKSDIANQYPVTVTETLDGNTIKVIYNGKEETIRYLLVDTPKSKKSGECNQPLAVDAKARNKQLVHSGKVTIEFEFGKNNIDKEGRILAYVFVNGASIQETLLKEGFARLDNETGERYKYLIPFISSQTAAKNQKLNIWSVPDYVTGNGFKQCNGSSAS